MTEKVAKVAKSKKKTKAEKAKDIEDAKIAKALSEVTPQDEDITALSEKDLLRRLVERLSYFDAEMILSAAMISAGVARKTDQCFKKREARIICLELIKRGGPAFAVGSVAYREFLG